MGKDRQGREDGRMGKDEQGWVSTVWTRTDKDGNDEQGCTGTGNDKDGQGMTRMHQRTSTGR
jgi:hypothetical protein